MSGDAGGELVMVHTVASLTGLFDDLRAELGPTCRSATWSSRRC